MQARMRLILEIHSYKVADNQYIAAYYLYIPKKNKQFAKHSSDKEKKLIKPQPKHSKIEISQYISMLTNRDKYAGGEREISSTMLQK